MTPSSLRQHSTSSSGIAVVTGGTAGLGRAIVRELAARGYDVAILARGQEGLDGAVHDVTGMGRRALGIPTDVADVDAVEAAASRVESELGPIDVWVNDAMVGVFGEFISTDPKDFERAFDVNFFGFVNGTRAALRRMQPRNSGTIVQIGSALAHRGIPLQASYCAAKHAITGFNESVLTELLHQKSKVTLSQVDMPAMNTIQFNWVKSQLPAPPAARRSHLSAGDLRQGRRRRRAEAAPSHLGRGAHRRHDPRQSVRQPNRRLVSRQVGLLGPAGARRHGADARHQPVRADRRRPWRPRRVQRSLHLGQPADLGDQAPDDGLQCRGRCRARDPPRRCDATRDESMRVTPLELARAALGAADALATARVGELEFGRRPDGR